ncbi:MAG: helix-turn-helix transcriptional regulator [Clostridia bacterium]|nr:helix-turn-helix transcriptional regulator [Clostridia bacterium]
MTAQFIRDRITQLRLQRDVSEYQMSYDLGHSRGYINNISSGKALPSMAEFLAICEYFGITPVEFFNGGVENPQLLRQTLVGLERLSENDLMLVRQLVERLSKT